MTTQSRTMPRSNSLATTVLFWGTMLLLSSLPDVLWAELTGEPATWILAAKWVLIAGVLLASLFNEEAARLRPFVIVIGVLYGALWGVQQIGKTALWQGWFGAWG